MKKLSQRHIEILRLVSSGSIGASVAGSGLRPVFYYRSTGRFKKINVKTMDKLEREGYIHIPYDKFCSFYDWHGLVEISAKGRAML